MTRRFALVTWRLSYVVLVTAVLITCSLEPKPGLLTTAGIGIELSFPRFSAADDTEPSVRVEVLPSEVMEQALVENGVTNLPALSRSNFEDIVQSGRALFFERTLDIGGNQTGSIEGELVPGAYHLQITVEPEGIGTFPRYVAATYLDFDDIVGSLSVTPLSPLALRADERTIVRLELRDSSTLFEMVTLSFVSQGEFTDGELPANLVFHPGDVVPIPAPDMYRADARFMHEWTDGTSNVLAGESVIVPETDLTFEAVWQTDFAVGDRGPAGGYVLYVDEENLLAGNYLEVASEDWYDAAGDPRFQQAAAAAESAAFAVHGIDDWYLPNEQGGSMVETDHELTLIDENLHSQGIGGFQPNLYWSSYNINPGGPEFTAYDFVTSNRQTRDESEEHFVRPVREF